MQARVFNHRNFINAVKTNNLEAVKENIRNFRENNNPADLVHLNFGLLWAASQGYLEIVNELIKIPNIDINAKDRNGQTVIMYASKINHLPIIESLLATKKVDLKKEDNHGRTVLHHAALSKNVDIIITLIQAGVPIHTPNEANRGETAQKALYALTFGGTPADNLFQLTNSPSSNDLQANSAWEAHYPRLEKIKRFMREDGFNFTESIVLTDPAFEELLSQLFKDLSLFNLNEKKDVILGLLMPFLASTSLLTDEQIKLLCNKMIAATFLEKNQDLMSYLEKNSKQDLEEYDLALMSNQELKKQTIECKSIDDGIEYRVIGLDNQKKDGKILWKDLPHDFPKDAAQMMKNKSRWLPVILELTSKRGYTHLEDQPIQKQCANIVTKELTCYFRDVMKRKNECVNAQRKRSLWRIYKFAEAIEGNAVNQEDDVKRLKDLINSEIKDTRASHKQSWLGFFGITQSHLVNAYTSALNKIAILEKSMESKKRCVSLKSDKNC